MEFPSLGKHCSERTCNRLDFLPVRCDACRETFCHNHMSYTDHHCTEGIRKGNFQVPVCPLCNKPVPCKRSEAPDFVVGAHIDADCQSDKAKSRRKVYSNRCNYKNCKKKEMMPLKCSQCGKNHCLTHRHPTDHECVPKHLPNKNNSLQPLRTQQSNIDSSYQNTAHYIQGSMSEDEALARAIQLSLATSSSTPVRGSSHVSSGSQHTNSNCNIS